MAMQVTMEDRQLVRGFGDEASIREQILQYTTTVTELSSQVPDLVAKYPQKWVALSNDGTLLIDDEFDALLAQCVESGFKSSEVAVRFLDTEKQVLIL